MSTTTLIIICYFVQIPLAIFGLFFMPRRGTLATPLENGRRNSALLGLLPCALASILIQVIFLGIYYGRVKAIERKENAIARGFSNSGGSAVTGDGNPLGPACQPGRVRHCLRTTRSRPVADSRAAAVAACPSRPTPSGIAPTARLQRRLEATRSHERVGGQVRRRLCGGWCCSGRRGRDEGATWSSLSADGAHGVALPRLRGNSGGPGPRRRRPPPRGARQPCAGGGCRRGHARAGNSRAAGAHREVAARSGMADVRRCGAASGLRGAAQPVGLGIPAAPRLIPVLARAAL